MEETKLTDSENTEKDLNKDRSIGDIISDTNGLVISVEGGSFDIVAGSITAAQKGFVINDTHLDNEESNYSLTALGDISGQEGGLHINLTTGKNLTVVCTGTIEGERAIQGELVTAPSITAWGLKSLAEDDVLVQVSDPELDHEILDQASYIVRMDESMDELTVDGLAEREIEGEVYRIARRGINILEVAAPDGLEIRELRTLTGSALVSKKTDGTYMLYVPDEGEVTLAAELEKATA